MNNLNEDFYRHKMSVLFGKNCLVNPSSVRFLFKNSKLVSSLGRRRFLTEETRKSSSSTTNESNSEKVKPEPKIDHLKHNPYFSKYESKLKNVYKYDIF